MKKAIKDFIKKSYFYQRYRHFKSEKRKKELEEYNANFRLECNDMFRDFCSALNKSGIIYWMDFGTLLGYYRENDFLKHDYDIDMAAFLKDAEIVRKALETNGFKRVRYYYPNDNSGLEEAYKYKRVTLDVFYYCQQGDILSCHSFRPLRKKILKKDLNKFIPMTVEKINVPYSGFQQVVFKGSTVYIPSDVVSHLKTHYGESFMVPNSNFFAPKDATNITYYTYEECPGTGFFKEKWI